MNMGRIAVCVLWAFLGLIAPGTVFATEYLVRNTIEFYGLPDLEPGDVVVLKNGVWENSFLEFEGTGTESMPITLRAETGGEVYLTGNSGLEIGGEYLVVDGLVFTQGYKSNNQVIAFRSSSSKHAYHCRLTNTKIIDFNPPSKSTEYKWVSMYGQYNRVDHCHFEGKNHAGAMLVVWLDGRANHHQIDSNYFGPRPDLGVNGGETIRVGTSDWSMSDSYTIVEGNLFDECDGEIEIISNKSCKNVYRHNTFLNSEGTLTLRHGNECQVYGNFFFGASNKESGGIRIIGEDHRVYNNYLQDIPGSGFRSAIALTNGVPDSPLNRYFQVINARVVNNTLVNCEHPITIGAGANSELSLPPKDCFIANNVIADYASVTDQAIEYDDDPENLVYLNNIIHAAELGIPSREGILEADPALVMSDLWRPADTSLAVGYGVDTFSYVSHDMDGHSRASTNDAGSDQLSGEEILYGPLSREDVGVRWANSVREVSAEEGGQVLREYISTAADGDVIILSTPGGVYQVDTSSVLTADITIRAGHGMDEKPVVEATGQVDEFILLSENAGLSLEGIDFKGGGPDENNFQHFLQTSPVLDANDTLGLEFGDCQFHDFTAPGASLLESTVPVVFSHLIFSDIQVFDVSGQAVHFSNGSHADSLVFSNCSFVNTGRQVLSMDLAVQGEGMALLMHCTIDSAGFEGAGHEVLSLRNVDATIRNSIISHSNASATAVSITGAKSSLDYCLFWNSGSVDASGGAVLGSSVIQDQDVHYSDRSRYYFSLLYISPAIEYADDGENLGDLYWNDHGILSDNAYLSTIEIDGVPVDGFTFDTFAYEGEVDEPDSYEVTTEQQDSTATVVISYPDTLPGICTIAVTAEDRITTQSYTLNLSSTSNTFQKGVKPGEQAFYFYPNPCDNILVIEAAEPGSARLYDMSGRLLRELRFYDRISHHSLSDMMPGYYYLSFQSENGTGNKTLLIL